MTHTMFMVWNSADVDELRATGFAAFGQRFEAYPYGSLHIVVLHAGHPDDRTDLGNLHPKLAPLPGMNGKLKKKHVDLIAKEFPNVKEGDTCSTVLSVLYAKYGSEIFNPDNY